MKLKLLAAVTLAALWAGPASSAPATVSLVDENALKSTTGSIGSTALVNSYNATMALGPIKPAPPILYNYSAGPCTYDGVVYSDPDVAVQIGSSTNYWCMAPNLTVDIRNFGTVQDFTTNTITTGITTGSGGSFSASGSTDTNVNLPGSTIALIGYNPTTGLVTLTTSSAHGVAVGQQFTVAGVTGAGASLVNGQYLAAANTSGINIYYNIAAGQSVSASGGTVQANFTNFPYNATTSRQVAVKISGLQQGTAALPAPNGIYPATYTGGNVATIKLVGVAWASGWTLQPGLSSAKISYVSGTDNGPLTMGTAPAVNNPIQRAISFACMLSSIGSVTVTDGFGGEGTAETIPIGQVSGTVGRTGCTGVTLNFAGLHALAPLPSAPGGWDEGYQSTRTVEYQTPASWNNAASAGSTTPPPGKYITPADSSGNGYVWNPPAVWPTVNLTKVFAGGPSNSLVGVQFSAPIVLAKGQQIYIHNSDVGIQGAGSTSGYLDGLWTIYDIASGYEGCTLPCSATGYLLANSDSSKIANLTTDPQYLFTSMKSSTGAAGGNIELDLTYPQYPSWAAESPIEISASDYPAVLSNSGAGQSWAITTVGSPATGVVLTGSTYPAGFDPTGSALPQAVVYGPIPQGMIDKGLNTSGIAINNSALDCSNQIGCVPVTNYSDADGFGGLLMSNDTVEHWNHTAVFTMGNNSHTSILGGVYPQTSGVPNPNFTTNISNTIGTLGVRSGIAFSFEGHQGDDLVGGGVIVPYNYQAFITGNGTLDVAVNNMHPYNGVPSGAISAAAVSAVPLDGPYYPDIEGTFQGTGSFVYALFDAGAVVIKTNKGATPYVQVSTNWNYNGGGGYADAPLEIVDDCLTFGCATLPVANGLPQGIDPNQNAATAPPFEPGGYLYGRLALSDIYGNIGAGRTWSQNSLAVASFYNTSGANSFDSPEESRLNGFAFTFGGSIQHGSLTVVSSGTVAGQNNTLFSSGVTNAIQPGMAIFGPDITPGTVVTVVTPGSSVSLSHNLVNSTPSGVTYSLPYIDQTVSTASTGLVVTLGSVANVAPGMDVLAINPSTGISVVQPNTEVAAVNTSMHTITLSLPLTTGGAASGQHFAFSGADYNNPANAPDTGFRITGATIFPTGGTSITSGTVLPSGFMIAGVNPSTNQIYLFQGSNSGVAPSSSASAAALTIGGVSGSWKGTISAGSWTITNVTYQNQPLSTLLRPGMMISDTAGGGCIPANSWIDSYNYLAGTITIENATDMPVSGACSGDTFTVTPFSYYFQAADAGSLFQVSNLSHSYSLYLPPYLPQGWSAKIATPTARPTVTLSELDGQALNLPTINGVNGVPATLVPNDLTGISSISVTSEGTWTGAAGGSVGYSNYTIPSHALANYTDPMSKLDVTPTSGTTISLSSAQTTLLIKGTSTLAALTVQLPPNATAWDGEKVTILPHPAITTLTVQTSTGTATIGPPTTAAANSSFAMIFDAASSNWYRAQ